MSSRAFLLHLVPEAALLELRLLGELHDESWSSLARCSTPLGEDEDLRDHEVPGLGEVLGVAVMLAARIARIVVLRAVHDAGLQGVDELSKPMATPLPPSEFMVSTKSGLPIMRILRPLRSSTDRIGFFEL
jgi:hypothetical protein